jgi:hypothetical protein
MMSLVPCAVSAQSAFLLATLLAGYVVCFALWWFVFRGRGDE